MKWLLNRLKERSTWSALIALASVAGVNLAPDMKEQIITAATAIVAIVMMITKDVGSPDSATSKQLESNSGATGSGQTISTPELTGDERQAMGLDN